MNTINNLVETTENPILNTAEMWLKAQEDEAPYINIDGDMAYSKKTGLVMADSLFSDEPYPWGLESFEHLNERGLDELMSSKWQKYTPKEYTIEEAEKEFNIKIIL